MESNKSNSSKNKKALSGKNQDNPAEFFRLTGQQVVSDIRKYDSVIAKNTSVFNSKPYQNEMWDGQNAVLKKRLNSMDSTMLEETAYNILDDSELKLEKKIENLEKTLQSINEKIVVAQTLNDSAELDELNLQREITSRHLQNLKNEYKTANVDTRFVSILVQILEFPQNFKQKFKKYCKLALYKSKFLKNIKPLVRSLMVRDTLGKLDKINKSVDELIKMQVPFGEQEARYEKLVTHLSKAGILHSQILKELKN